MQRNFLSFRVLQDLVITDCRYNLGSDKADKLVFIMQNYSALENYIKKWPIEQENESDIGHESDLKYQRKYGKGKNNEWTIAKVL